MGRIRTATSILLISFPLVAPGCKAFDDFIEALSCFAYGPCYGTTTEAPSSCVPKLVCRAPVCVAAEENGSFEADQWGDAPSHWYGDQTEVTALAVCGGSLALEFLATTPEGPSPSQSSQVFQIFNYNDIVPESARAAMRRVRVQAAFTNFFLPDDVDDRQFGLRIDAYSGDPSTFPRAGDPESLPTEASTYRRLDTVGRSGVLGITWLPFTVEMWLPEGTSFFVVLLEAFEDNVNEVGDEEFGVQFVDVVQVAIDGGNTPPEARPDMTTTFEGTPVSIPVLLNDFDGTSLLDRASLAVEEPPTSGTVERDTVGLRYTPDSGFVGEDSLTYTVADEEGLVSNEATVTIRVQSTGYDLALDKTASASRVSNSNPVTFTVRVTNNGPFGATGVRVRDRMPAINQTLQNTQTSQGGFSVREDSDLTTITWDVGDLPANATATLNITVLAHLALTNTAEITGGLTDDTDPNNNSDSFTVTVGN